MSSEREQVCLRRKDKRGKFSPERNS